MQRRGVVVRRVAFGASRTSPRRRCARTALSAAADGTGYRVPSGATSCGSQSAASTGSSG
ncbi:hypothetical protein ACFQ9X_25680 [Catenulispora yoronensis]